MTAPILFLIPTITLGDGFDTRGVNPDTLTVNPVTQCVNFVTLSIAPMPPQMIPKSIATPGLLAHIFVSKFCDALPFYRQEKQFKRYGVDLGRETMVNWALKVGKKLKPLFEMLRLYVLSGPLINVDETTVQELREPGRSAQSKSYSWVLRGGPPRGPGFLYHYAPSRGSKVARELLKDYEGFVRTDGFSSYNFLDKHLKIEHFGCWAHVRRGFNNVSKACQGGSKGLAEEALTMIGSLYKIERAAIKDGFNEEYTYQLRQPKPTAWNLTNI